MATHLLTWSDRGVSGPRPSHHGDRPASDRGPVARLLDQPESAGRYDSITILTTPSGQERAHTLFEDLRCGCVAKRIRVQRVPLVDPSSYREVFGALGPLLPKLRCDGDLDVLLSAGTPQMQTIWFVLVKSGLLPARMLQVVPAAFVPDPHPRAIRVVDVDIEGFPDIRVLQDEVERLRAEVQTGKRHLVGDSPPMRELRRLVVRVARASVPVIVQGETGTGKELVARAIHDASDRENSPFVAENCGAFSESVLQSELFGHERGAFTGAHATHRGLFEQADGGTLFLDEVGELSPRVQATLLRVLQEGTLRRVGGETTVRVDVRMIAATHRDLPAMVRAGEFREDLMYRLRGATLRVPPLRERREDIEPLVRLFLRQMGSELQVFEQALHVINRYAWPGNVRELRAEVIRWTVFCERRVRLEDVAPEILTAPEGGSVDVASTLAELQPLAVTVRDAERRAISAAYRLCDGNLSKTARKLGIHRNTLKRKLRRDGAL